MNKYTTPEMEVIVFSKSEVIVASSIIVTTEYNGGQIELPDHEWD